jgi:PEP-CTERM motif
MKKALMVAAYLLFVIIFATTAWCGMIINAEAPGVQSTQVSGAVTDNFNSLPQGYQTNVTFDFGGTPDIQGTYDKLYIRNPDIYGGANATKYPVAAYAYGTSSYELTLTQAVNYFGMYWSAGDASNLLTFYLGNTQVASYSTATAMGLFPAAYYGNPSNNYSDSGEPFAYLNFFGTNGTTFDKIVFTATNYSGGFESDNHAILQNATPTGGTINLNPVPEPATMILLGLGLMGLAGIRRKFHK